MGKRPILIGLTGNIACGKSTVARMLAEKGAYIIDADAIAHEVIRKGTPAYEAILRRFGEGILGPDGEIDRRRLGAIVFRDLNALRDLEAIVHPAVLVEIQRRIQACPEAPAIVIEAIKLIESGFARACDTLWVVTCSESEQVRRLMIERGLAEEEARVRIRAQPPQEEKIRHAHVIIDNSGDLEATRRQVEQAWREWIDPDATG
ncbi:MAG: dephospho-CoA kinase [Thermoflexus sp.]|uniref:dephospho-CoA kinase n=1 Tax=Thermoflexus sp. TaxID=1969742 RepID=UPI0025E4F371|nr:dephospho-CoA kinase [Thermoflexus sp.]MCS6962513.1 dephospho-CoA kinase [Thermoflexus sp.]MCS7350651.1 dephospho-CoA kinase [Thermoflexus sp.]MDW8180102.1 dephospho-CoA kinase [Anaerolineae bacterium]MDW8185795.1 dephospho-CoA kinase [Anaerolineae bacterium]